MNNHLRDSSHLFLCISAEDLTEGIDGQEPSIMRKTRLDRMIALIAQLPHNSGPPTIVIVITKCDLLRHRRKEEVINDIKRLFHLFFVEDSAWTVAVCPVTLGKSLQENPLKGRIEPENVHLPIMFALWQTLARGEQNDKPSRLAKFITSGPKAYTATTIDHIRLLEESHLLESVGQVA